MPIFARRHYQAIAEVICHCSVCHMEESSDIEFTAHELANMFLRDNPNFNREKFLKVCGMGE